MHSTFPILEYLIPKGLAIHRHYPEFRITIFAEVYPPQPVDDSALVDSVVVPSMQGLHSVLLYSSLYWPIGQSSQEPSPFWKVPGGQTIKTNSRILPY